MKRTIIFYVFIIIIFGDLTEILAASVSTQDFTLKYLSPDYNIEAQTYKELNITIFSSFAVSCMFLSLGILFINLKYSISQLFLIESGASPESRPLKEGHSGLKYFSFICQPSCIVIVIFLGFLIRMLWWTYAEPIPVSDFEGYRDLAEKLLEHNQLGYPNPSALPLPGYPLFLAIMMMISKSVVWLSFVNVLLSTMLIYLVYRFTFYLTGEPTTSVLAAIACGFNPTFIFFSPVLASEHLYVILLLSGLIMIVNLPNNQFKFSIKSSVLAGILFGAAVLTRGEALFYIPVFLAVLFISFRKFIYRFSSILVFLFAFAVTICPWYVRNLYLVGPGSGLSTTGGLNFYYAHNDNHYGWHSLKGTVFEGLGEVEQQKLGYKLGFQYFSNDTLIKIVKNVALGTERLFFEPSSYSVSWSTKLPRKEPGGAYPNKQLIGVHWFAGSTYAYYILLFGAVLSCIFLSRYSPRIWVALYGFVTMNWIGYSWVFWGKPRYRYVSEVVFCILTSLILYEAFKHFLRYMNMPRNRKGRVSKHLT